MKSKKWHILTVLIIVCAVLIGISLKDEKTPLLETDLTTDIIYNDNTPDFTYSEFKEADFSSREDVYKEYQKLNRQFDEFIGKYENQWTDSKRNKNYEIFGEYIVKLNNMLEDKFPEKSDGDILAEKKELIEREISNLSDDYIFAKKSGEMCTDEKEKESYKNDAVEKEKIYLEAKAFYDDFNEGRHTVDDVLRFLKIAYDENANPLFIPMEYRY